MPPSDGHNLIDSLCGRSGHGDGRKLKLHQNHLEKSSMSVSQQQKDTFHPSEMPSHVF